MATSLEVIYCCIFFRVASIYFITRLRILDVATLFITNNSVRNWWDWRLLQVSKILQDTPTPVVEV